MIKLKKENTKRMLSVHGWAGIVLGLMLYVVVLTGAIVVFSHEIGAWSVSGAKHHDALSLSINDDIQQFAKTIPAAYLEHIDIQGTADGQVQVFFHTHKARDGGQPEEFGVRYKFDPTTGEVFAKHKGYASDFPKEPSSVLERFLLDLHVSLHVPGKLGLYLTGVLGLVLLVAAISGFLLHRHLFKDMFLSPRGGNPALTARDKHNLAGTWGLPFSFVLAFTGAFFSFALSLGLPVIAMTAFGGDQEKALETIVGVPEKENHSPATMANLDTAIANATKAEGAPVVFASVVHWGTADAKMLTFHDFSDDELYPDSHEVSMVTGEHLHSKPRLGTQPSVGNDLVNLMGVLHFGMFAGLLSRLIWFALGLATCHVTLTGMQLWLVRRADTKWRKFAPLVPMVGYGLPISVATCALGFFASYPAAHTFGFTAWGFVIGMVLSSLVLLFHPFKQLLVYQLMLGVLAIAVVVVRWLSSGAGWFELFAQNHAVVIGMDIGILLVGVLSFYAALKARQKYSANSAESKPVTNAEENRRLADAVYDAK